MPVRTAEAVRRVLATNEGNVKFQVRGYLLCCVYRTTRTLVLVFLS